jgi:hypothetical protein
MQIPGVTTENFFPDRKEIKKTYVDNIIEQAKLIDVEKIDDTKSEFKPRNQIIEEQKVYFWIRVYLHDEVSIEPNTDVTITYRESGEKLTTKFICYAKKGAEKNQDENVINYNPDEDKKVWCLMIDADRIDKNSQDIPFIRSLFRISRWYSPQILRLIDLDISYNDTSISYYDIDF